MPLSEMTQRSAVSIVDGARAGERRVVIGACLDQQRSLARRRHQLAAGAPPASEKRPSRRARPGAGAPARRPRLRRAPQPRVDIATELDDLRGPRAARGAGQRGAGCSYQPGRRIRATRTRPKPQSTSRGSWRRDRGDRSALSQLARDVLGRVHRDVDLAGEQRPLERGGPARLVVERARRGRRRS